MKTFSSFLSVFVKLLFLLVIVEATLTSGSTEAAAAAAAAEVEIGRKEATAAALPPTQQTGIVDQTNVFDKNDLKSSASENSQRILAKQNSQDQVTSPSSLTSVHQVWTSSSSGNLNELSPEVISNLRNDVPFLAAYALRPRLVGANNNNNNNNNNDQLSSSSSSPNNGQPIYSYTRTTQLETQAPATSSPGSKQQYHQSLALQTSASSPLKSSLIPSLGDFSEFKVETLSTSKSEHHHKRKTVLKRQNNKDEETNGGDKLDSNLIKQRRATLKRNTKLKVSTKKSKKLLRRHNNGVKQKSHLGNNNKLLPLDGRRKVKNIVKSMKQKIGGGGGSSGVKGGETKRKSGKQINLKGKLRLIQKSTKTKKNLVAARNGRYLQDQDSSSINSLDQSTKGGGVDAGQGVKGGAKKAITPFYSRVQPAATASGAKNDQSDNSLSTTSKSKSDSEANDNETIVEDEEEEESLAEPPSSPSKRVGDDDVEEDGDTVTVMPKFDGVDDDPELGPEEEQDDSSSQEEREEGLSPDIKGADGGVKNSDSEPRTKGINRQKPNDDKNQVESGSPGGGSGSVAGGGGLGVTINGGGGSSSGDKNNSGAGGSAFDKDDGTGDDDDVPRRKVDRVTPGVEFANKDNDDDGGNNKDKVNSGESDSSSSSGGTANSSSEASEEETIEENQRGNKSGDGEKSPRINPSIGGDVEMKSSPFEGGNGRMKESGFSSSSSSGSADSESETEDIDYRDEMDQERKKKGGEMQHHHQQGIDTTKKKATSGGDCNDGSYNHDHHDHDHHNSIKWLQDAIPGEPGDDYPILSRVNLSNFNCADQKHPGYYADVESRCQVFHICQADGRQDSFL